MEIIITTNTMYLSSRSVVAEMAVYLQEVENKTLLEKLDWIYDIYGFHVSNNSYFLCYSQETIQKMFNRLRHYEGISFLSNNKKYNIEYNFFLDKTDEEFTYPTKCGPYKINKIRDLTVGLIVDFKKNGEKSKPVNN